MVQYPNKMNSQTPICAGHYCDCGRARSDARSPEFIPSSPVPVPRLSLPPPPRLQRQGALRMETPEASPIVSSPNYLERYTGTGTLEADSLDSDSDCTYSDMPPLIPAERPVARHLFFNDEGEEITREEYTAQNWAIKLPALPSGMIARHPRVLLALFEFLDVYNEVAKGSEMYMMPALPQEVVERIYEHPSFRTSRHVFPYEISTLENYIEKHKDLSG